jgi:hypothetical protein
MATVTIEFKDPDFAYKIEGAGVESQAVEVIHETAEFGEYYSLQLTLDNRTGAVTKARFVK